MHAANGRTKPAATRSMLEKRTALIIGLCLLGLHAISVASLIAPTEPRAGAPSAGRLLLDPNTATAAELELLPGVGPVLAQRIVEFRSSSDRRPAFRSADDLAAVQRIGPVTVEKLRPFLVFGRATPRPADVAMAPP